MEARKRRNPGKDFPRIPLALHAGFCNGPWFVNPTFPLARILSPGSCFCTGSARGRHLMGSEEDKAGQSTLSVIDVTTRMAA